MRYEIENLNGLQLAGAQVDTAAEVQTFYAVGNEDNQQYIETPMNKGVYNVQEGKLASVVSKKYQIIQHAHVMEALINTLGGLGMEVSGRFDNYHDWVRADLVFTNKGAPVKDDADGVMLGIRVINSYNKTAALRFEMFAFRLICANGMSMGQQMEVKEIVFHTGITKTYELISQTVEEFVSRVINSSEKLQAYVSGMMKDGVEWELAKQVLGVLITRKKHRKAIQLIFETNTRGQSRVTRWDVYNAITEYTTHHGALKPTVETYLEKQSQRLLKNELESFIEVEA